MEKIHQAVGVNGLQIPMAVIRQVGLEQGSSVVLELDADIIRIVPAQPDQATIENRALRYVLSTIGDAATIKVRRLANGDGWQVDVYGPGMAQPAGTLAYSLPGTLLVERSTSPQEIRRVLQDAFVQP